MEQLSCSSSLVQCVVVSLFRLRPPRIVPEGFTFEFITLFYLYPLFYDAITVPKYWNSKHVLGDGILAEHISKAMQKLASGK